MGSDCLCINIIFYSHTQVLMLSKQKEGSSVGRIRPLQQSLDTCCLNNRPTNVHLWGSSISTLDTSPGTIPAASTASPFTKESWTTLWTVTKTRCWYIYKFDRISWKSSYSSIHFRLFWNELDHKPANRTNTSKGHDKSKPSGIFSANLWFPCEQVSSSLQQSSDSDCEY